MTIAPSGKHASTSLEGTSPMNSLHVIAASLIFGVPSVGCAAPSGDEEQSAPAVASDLTQALSDSALEGKLKGILKDVSFTSESDFPYIVFEGGAVTESQLTEALVRER